jgi:hypothetical protein
MPMPTLDLALLAELEQMHARRGDARDVDVPPTPWVIAEEIGYRRALDDLRAVLTARTDPAQ